MLPTYSGYSFPQLNKLDNASYIRSHTFMEQSVDVYSYDVSGRLYLFMQNRDCFFWKLMQMTAYEGYTEKLEIAYSTIDYTPAYLVISPDMYSSPVIVNSFSGVAPSYSKFDLPYQCSVAKKSKVTKGKAKGKKPRFQPNNIFHKPKHIWMRTNWTKKLEQVWQQCIVL